MKKVLHILNSLLPSGAETMLKTAGIYWDTELEHHVLATGEQLGDFAVELENAGYHIHHIYFPNFFTQLSEVKKLIQLEKFDIVHVHRESKALEYEVIAKMAGVKRIVRTVHNVFLFDGILRARRIVTRQLGCLIGVKHIAISQSVLDNERQRFFVKCVLINNWYDENKYLYVDDNVKKEARRVLGINEDQICLISVGNCSKVKNHIVILKSLNYLEKEKVIYFHVGKGSDEEKERLYVQQNHLEENVRFEGFKDPLIYLRASDYFIMPSIYEGVGISALEAIATGMPCLLTDVYGLKDFKKYNFEQVDYCALNDDDIVSAIKKNCESGRKKNSISQSEKVKTNYGIAQGVAGYQEVYGL